MTVSGGLDQVAPGLAWMRSVAANVARYLALLSRKPRHAHRSAWLAPLRLAGGGTLVLAALAASMIAFDAWTIELIVRGLPDWLIITLDRATDLGKATVFLLPIALALAALALVASPALSRTAKGAVAAVAVRLGFLLLAVGLPGLVFLVVKHVIGRARPLVEGTADPFIYRPLAWNMEYASLPSGHALDAFAIAIAVGALWPRLRALLWTYACVIAVSRVVLRAHFPSDVAAGAVIGVLGALLVREWFAARGLAFLPTAEGGLRPLPWPSFARVKRVARQLIAS
jgi:membrane-associated phospholipid phosphatase